MISHQLAARGDPAAWAWYREAGTMLALGMLREPEGAQWIASAATLEHLAAGAMAPYPWWPDLHRWVSRLEAREPSEMRQRRAAIFAAPGRGGREALGQWMTKAGVAGEGKEALHLADRPDGWLVAAALLRHMEKEGVPQGATGSCGSTPSLLWTEVCATDRPPRYQDAQAARLDSIVSEWRSIVPERFPVGLVVTGSTRQWHSRLLDHRKAIGLTAWRPRIAVIDTHEEEGERIAAVLAHELGHQADFIARGPWRVNRDTDTRVEAIADSIESVILCETSPGRVDCGATSPPRRSW